MENNTVKFSLVQRMCCLLGVCLDGPAGWDGDPTTAGCVGHSFVKSLHLEVKARKVKKSSSYLAAQLNYRPATGVGVPERRGGGGAADTRAPFL